MLEKLGADGDWLVQQLKPVGAKAGRAARDPASIVRDQLWVIINERHDELRQAGAVLFGLKNLDEHVPPLLARAAATSVGRGGRRARRGRRAKPEAAVSSPSDEIARRVAARLAPEIGLALPVYVERAIASGERCERGATPAVRRHGRDRGSDALQSTLAKYAWEVYRDLASPRRLH